MKKNCLIHAVLVLILITKSLFCDAQISFIKHVVSNRFVSEGVSAGDVNHDGKTDILAGNYWYEAFVETAHVTYGHTKPCTRLQYYIFKLCHGCKQRRMD